MDSHELHIGRRGLLKATCAVALGGCGRSAPGSRRTGEADLLAADDALALAARVRSREVSPLELVDHVIARIESLEGELQALSTRTFERARARALDPVGAGPFAGVPFLIKDMVDCAGIPRTDGANIVFTRTPDESPALMKSIERSGLNIVGVTNVPEFATLPATLNERFGMTRNPWDTTRTPAGSSGGSAVAVAAGYVPLAHATDGAGSIRLPSSYCGVFGFKPSRGRTRSGEADGGHDLVKHHHAISRSVRDSAALLSVTEDRSPRARYAPIGFVRSEEAGGEAPAKLRVGLDLLGVAGVPPSPPVAEAIDSTARLLDGLGHEILPLPAFPVSPEAFWIHVEAVFLSRMPGLVRLTEALTGSSFEQATVLSNFTKTLARAGIDQPAGALEAAAAWFATLSETTSRWMAEVDVVLSPVQPDLPPAIDRWKPSSTWEAEAESIRAFMNTTALANVIGAPAMSVPLHWTSAGLPIGSHFQARPGEDERLLALAYQLESARPWAGRWAPHSIVGIRREAA